MGKLYDVIGNIQVVLDKFKGIKVGFVQGQFGWQDWDFFKLIEVLRCWREVNLDEVMGIIYFKILKDFLDI